MVHVFVPAILRRRAVRRGGVRLLIGALLAVTAFADVVATNADQYTDRISKDQQQQKHYNQVIASLEQQIAAAQDKEAKLQSIITSLAANIQTTQNQVAAAQVKLAQITATLQATQAQLAHTRATLAAQKQQLSRELVIIYETENQSTPIANLVASGDFNSFWVQVINDQRIGEIEMRTVDRIHAEEAAVSVELAQIQAQQQQQNQTLADLYATRQQLNDQLQAQQVAVARLAAEQMQDQAKIAQINAANDALNAEIQQLQGQEQAALATGGGSGRFVWPDAGPITQGFGCTQWTFEPYDPGCPSPHRFHNGLDIGGPCGHSILAADAGIAYPEPFQAYGFGNYVIIVHGNGWQTLYGHLGGFAIRAGQAVSRGQLIGFEGTTGNSTGCHLHFSVNHFGAWVNPLSYLG